MPSKFLLFCSECIDGTANRPQHKDMTRMMIPLRTFALVALSFAIGVQTALATNQAKSIINALDPKTMNELLEAARRQPDTALTNIIPISANKFRFLFVWPAANPIMTHDRIGRSFAERFLVFANQQKLLVTGYCLPSRNMFFGSAEYGEEEVNVAYRDIEVHFQFGSKPACPGRYIAAAELEPPQPQPSVRTPKSAVGISGSSQPQKRRPEDELKPFLTPVPGQ